MIGRDELYVYAQKTASFSFTPLFYVSYELL